MDIERYKRLATSKVKAGIDDRINRILSGVKLRKLM